MKKSKKISIVVVIILLLSSTSILAGSAIADSYKHIQVTSESENSWEDAAYRAVMDVMDDLSRNGKTLKDLRVDEVTLLDMKVENGKVTAYRARVQLSFKYMP